MDPQTPVSPVSSGLPPAVPSLPTVPGAPQAPPQPNQSGAPSVAPSSASVETADAQIAQIVQVINNGKNVLVTVGTNPTVDELASALGLTVVLGKIGKHATAVFSGSTPPAMEFLDPDNTFENTVDSLRDFIIALDKEKADKLRYKVEDDVVKIFITPYKTVLTQKDLQFSQGDFNIDVVIALGALNRDELDKAITAHGRILHDATVVAINAGVQKSNLGTVNWNEGEASSVAEMLLNLVDQLDSQLLDTQSATAFLTGIVAETSRFSNEKTSPKVMTLAAQLMAAGANQQLIASNLRQEGMLSESIRNKSKNQPQDDSGEMVLDHNAGKSPQKNQQNNRNNQPNKSPQNNNAPQKKQPNQQPKQAQKNKQPKPDSSNAPDVSLKLALDTQDAQQTGAEQPAASQQTDTVVETIATPTEPPTAAPVPPENPPIDIPEPVQASDTPAPSDTAVAPSITLPSARDAMTPPQFGGTLNATQLNDEPPRAPDDSGLDTPATLTHENDGVIGSEDAIEAARKAVEDAAVDPPHKRLDSIGSTPLPEVQEAPTIDSAAQTPTPMESTALPAPQPFNPAPFSPAVNQTDGVSGVGPLPYTTPPSTPDLAPRSSEPAPAPAPVAAFTPPTAPPLPPHDASGLPPLPPLPGAAVDSSGALPPLPPLPGSQPTIDPTASFQPQTSPEFMQNMPQSQNTWTQAGNSLADQTAQAEADRQAKIDTKVGDYEQAVDRNRELQGKPPLNNPNGSGLPPLPPVL